MAEINSESVAAELSGFGQQYIGGLEQGQRNPTVVSLYELATALGVSHMGGEVPRLGPRIANLLPDEHIIGDVPISDHWRNAQSGAAIAE